MKQQAVNRVTAAEKNAIRNHKAIRVPFNAYEYDRLERLAAHMGLSKLSAIRYAITKCAKMERVPEG